VVASPVTDLVELTRELTELEAPVGHEGPVADWLERRWQHSCEDVSRTPIGNVVAHLGGAGPRLLLTAHMDEINLIIERIDDRGFAWLTSCHPGTRTYHLRECLNREAIVKTPGGDVEAIFASLTGHLRFGSKAHDNAPGWEDVYLDFGLDHDAVFEAGVRAGQPVLYRSRMRRLGELLAMKAADDRIGLVVLTAFIEEVERAHLAWDVTLVATVQEEAGALGAASIRADIGTFEAAVVYDVGPAGDLGVIPEHGCAVALGGGPVLVHKDTIVAYDAALTARLEALAQSQGMPVQHAVYPECGTDGVELVRQGIPTAFVGVPTRYTHSPHELVSEQDVRSCIALTTALCTTPRDFQTQGATRDASPPH
jgi:putative aminopeptidase FrvX